MSYKEFIAEFINYISTQRFSECIALDDGENAKQSVWFFVELYKIILSYSNPSLTLLCDFSTTHQDINQYDKINCLAKHPTYYERPCDNQTSSDKSIWVAINNHILCYDEYKNLFTEQLHSICTEYVCNNPSYFKIEKMIKQVFISYDKRVIIAQNGYCDKNLFIGAPDDDLYRSMWKQFINCMDAPIDFYDQNKPHYITSELFGIMCWLGVNSGSEMFLNCNDDILDIKLYEFDDENWLIDVCQNTTSFKQKIRINNNCNYSLYVPTFCGKINDIFDVNKHCILLYGDKYWILYLPIRFYTNKDTKINLRNKRRKSNKKKQRRQVIQIEHSFLYLYRKTDEYVLYVGKKQKGEFKLLPFSTKQSYEYFDAFDVVLKDDVLKRYLVTKNTKLFQIKLDS
eukprot:79068_1